jgi:hypothetical protein
MMIDTEQEMISATTMIEAIMILVMIIVVILVETVAVEMVVAESNAIDTPLSFSHEIIYPCPNRTANVLL